MWAIFLGAALAAPELVFTATDAEKGTDATCTVRPGEPCVVWLRSSEGNLTIALAPIAAYPTPDGDRLAVQVRIDRHGGGVVETLLSKPVVLSADRTSSYVHGAITLDIRP